MIFIPIKGMTTPPNPKISKFLLRSADAPIGLYATPFKAKGMRMGIIMALKITADKMAVSGL